MDVPATVTSKGQVTLPKSVRESLQLKAGDRVLFRVLNGRAVPVLASFQRLRLTRAWIENRHRADGEESELAQAGATP